MNHHSKKPYWTPVRIVALISGLAPVTEADKSICACASHTIDLALTLATKA